MKPPTTTLKGKDEILPELGSGPLGDENPEIVGYVVLPIDYMAAFKTAGFNFLLLMCLIAGYILWARDTQLMRGAGKKGGL